MNFLREWTDAWFAASARTRVVACVLLFGANWIGFALLLLEMGKWTEATLQAVYVLAAIGLLSILAALFLAASQIARTFPSPVERNHRLKGLAKTVGWYALVGPLDILMHRAGEYPVLRYGLFFVTAFGLMHLTAKVSQL